MERKLSGIPIPIIWIHTNYRLFLFLSSRFEKAETFKGTIKNHQFISNGGSISGVDFAVLNLTEHSPGENQLTLSIKELKLQKFYACYYEKDWYFWIVNYVSIENNDANVTFLHIKRPASKYCWPSIWCLLGFCWKYYQALVMYMWNESTRGRVILDTFF